MYSNPMGCVKKYQISVRSTFDKSSSIVEVLIKYSCSSSSGQVDAVFLLGVIQLMLSYSLQQRVTVTLTQQQQHEAEAYGTIRSCRRCIGRCSRSPGPQRATWRSGTHLLYDDTHFSTMSLHEIPGAGSQTGQLRNTHFNMLYTTSHRGDDRYPGRISTKWYKVTGTATGVLGIKSGAAGCKSLINIT